MLNIPRLTELLEMAPPRPWEMLADYTERGQAAQQLAVAALKALPEMLADRVQSANNAALMLVDYQKAMDEIADTRAVLEEQIKIEREVAREMMDEKNQEIFKLRTLLAEVEKLLSVYGHYDPKPNPVLVAVREVL